MPRPPSSEMAANQPTQLSETASSPPTAYATAKIEYATTSTPATSAARHTAHRAVSDGSGAGSVAGGSARTELALIALTSLLTVGPHDSILAPPQRVTRAIGPRRADS